MVVGFTTTYAMNLCLSPLTLWVRIPLGQFVLDTALCDKICQWLGQYQKAYESTGQIYSNSWLEKLRTVRQPDLHLCYIWSDKLNSVIVCLPLFSIFTISFKSFKLDFIDTFYKIIYLL
jgi:hypothetical protein